MVELDFDGLPPSPNRAGSGQHWSKGYKDKREWQDRVGYTALAAKVKQGVRAPYHRAVVEFDICVGDKRPHDPDNLAWAVTKPTLDGLKGILIEDDSIDHIQLAYTFRRDGLRGFRVRVIPLLEEAEMKEMVGL